MEHRRLAAADRSTQRLSLKPALLELEPIRVWGLKFSGLGFGF